MKRIVIISGITGAIGSSLLSEYAQSDENIIYGISRKALPHARFLFGGKLPQKTLICSIKIPIDYQKFFRSIDYSGVDEVVYVHSLGLYPFEVNEKGEVVIENDSDNDGINDETTLLTYTAFKEAVMGLVACWRGKTKCVIFGGLADKHEPAVHQSWWKTIKKVKEWSIEVLKENSLMSVLVFNISSVICPHEIITRPFVFINTDADQTKWLHPNELAKFVVLKTDIAQPGMEEIEKYRTKDKFDPENYYADSIFTPRKVSELY